MPCEAYLTLQEGAYNPTSFKAPLTKYGNFSTFFGPIEPKKFDFSYKPIGMPPIPIRGLKTAKKGVCIAFLLLTMTISGS